MSPPRAASGVTPQGAMPAVRPGRPGGIPADLDQLFEQLRQGFDTFSPRFQQVARHLLDHPQEVPVNSMRRIAQQAGVAPAALIRFAQHLGFEGWPPLRELFVRAWQAAPQAYARRAEGLVGAAHGAPEWVAAQHQNLDHLLDQTDPVIDRAAQLLETAPRVYIAGFRACFPLAFALHYEYRLFRQDVALIRGDAGALELELRPLAAGDAVVVASFAPYSTEAVRVAEAAHAADCRVVALSDSVVSPIARVADVCLRFSVEGPSFFPSITAGMALVEMLVERLLALRGPQAVKLLEKAEAHLHGSGAYVPR